MSDEKEIKKPIDPEKEKAGETRGEALEKEPKTLEEEVERGVIELENAKAFIAEQQEKDEKTLAINDADESNREEFSNGKKVIGEKVKAAEGEYEEEINKIRGDVANKIIYNKNNMENKGEFSRELTINEVFDSIIERANQIYFSNMTIAEKKQEIKILFDEQTKATTNDERFDDTARKTGKWREAGNTLFEIDKRLVFNESEEKFDDAFKSVEVYNQTMPNYFRKRSENLGKIVGELKNKKIDQEIISLVEKIVIEDRKNMINTMCGKESIDIYYANPGSDNSKIDFDTETTNLYIDHLLKKDIKESEVEKQLKDVDDKLTAMINDFSINLFASEYDKARIFFEKVNKSNNPKERQVYCVVIKHILDGIEKGIKDKGIRDALKNKF